MSDAKYLPRLYISCHTDAKKRLTIRFLSKSDAQSALFQRFTISTLKSASESPALLAASEIASKPSFTNDTNVSI